MLLQRSTDRHCAKYSVTVTIYRDKKPMGSANRYSFLLYVLVMGLVLCVKFGGSRLLNSCGNWIRLFLQSKANLPQTVLLVSCISICEDFIPSPVCVPL